MPRKIWPKYSEQKKMFFKYTGETPVKIPYPGGFNICNPDEVVEFPEEIGLKLVGRKGFVEAKPEVEVPEARKKKADYKKGKIEEVN